MAFCDMITVGQPRKPFFRHRVDGANPTIATEIFLCEHVNKNKAAKLNECATVQ